MLGFVKAQGPPPPSGNSIFITNSPSGTVCAGVSFQLDYDATGTFNPGNFFVVYISDSTGNFGQNPQAIGSIPAVNSGSISVTVPGNFLASANYQIYVASTDPVASSFFTPLQVNDNPVPVVSAAGPIAFCEGGSVDLTSTPGASYLWSTGDTTQSINISQTDSGVFVKVTNINGCSANSSLLDVIVFPNPDRPQITASGPLCTGSTITLSSDQTTDISWNTGETSADISVSSPGTYTVLYIDSNGCSGEGSFEVLQSTTPATPNLGGPYSVCGGTVDLDAGSYVDPVTYIWSTGETTQTITVTSTNNYSVTVSNADGCTAEAFAEVSILSPPDASITNSNGSSPLCSGASLTLSVSSQPGATYSWSNGATTSTTVITAGGNYSVTVTGSNGCSSSNSTSVNEISCVPATQLRVQDCGYLAFNLSSSIIADLVSGATQYQFEFSNAAGTTVLATVSNATRTLALSSVSPAIQWNTQYSVRVRAFTGTIPGPFGAACIIGTIPDPNSTVPTTQLRSLDCGSTSLSLTSIIQANPVTGATQYEFQFSQGSTVVSTKLQTSLQCNLGSLNPALNWSNTYSVRVRAYIGALQGTYGPACNITIIADPSVSGVPTTQLVAANCGRLNYSLSTGGCAAVAVTGASSYIFEFLQNGNVVGTRTAPTRICYFNQVVPALSSLQVYQCRVKVVIGGVTGNPGAICNVGFVPGSRFGTTAEDLELMPGEEGLLNPAFEVTMMPNPFQGQTLLQFNGRSENLQIRIFDLGGKLVAEERINGASQYYLGASLNKGVYILEVADSFGNVNRQKLVKSEE
jgi:hypothetical protein